MEVKTMFPLHSGSYVLASFMVLVVAVTSGIHLGFHLYVSSPSLPFAQGLFSSFLIATTMFGPPCLVLAGASLPRRFLALAAVLVFLSGLVLTHSFGTSPSSTAVFVYWYGLIVGMPLALVVLLVSRRCRNSSSR